MNHYNNVRTALQDLCKKDDSIVFFRVYYSAANVAAQAGCSVTTARKYLERLAMCRDYSRFRFSNGTYGYRYKPF